MFSVEEAKKKECRLVPMMIVQGPLGQPQMAAPNCSGDACMHWVFCGERMLHDCVVPIGCCAMDTIRPMMEYSAPPPEATEEPPSVLFNPNAIR